MINTHSLREDLLLLICEHRDIICQNLINALLYIYITGNIGLLEEDIINICQQTACPRFKIVRKNTLRTGSDVRKTSEFEYNKLA